MAQLKVQGWKSPVKMIWVELSSCVTSMACGIWTQLNMDAETMTFNPMHVRLLIIYIFVCCSSHVCVVSFVIDNFGARAIVLTNLGTAAIVFSLGVVTGIAVCICCRKLQCNIHRKQMVPPKDIELRDNPAYGPIQRTRQWLRKANTRPRCRTHTIMDGCKVLPRTVLCHPWW